MAQIFSLDVAILTFKLRRLKGLQVGRHLAQRRVATIAVTGYRGKEFRQLAASAGFVEYLEKPVHPEVLKEVLSRILPVNPDGTSARKLEPSSPPTAIHRGWSLRNPRG
jgi:CheY-like chemotaxis protein